MERRHDPAMFGAAPGLVVAPYSAVAPYPAAAVLASWANARLRDPQLANIIPPLINWDEPVLPAAAELSFWPQARVPLGQALALIPQPWWSARCVLPVPGDPGGLPAGCPRALSAGQAVVWSHLDTSVVLSPLEMPGGDRMWVAERASSAAAAPATARQANREIMAALERCVALAEAALLPRQTMASALVSQVADLPVPLPPDSEAATVALARQSATVIAIVATAMNDLPETSEAATLRDALAPLGRAARQGLSVAFSQNVGR